MRSFCGFETCARADAVVGSDAQKYRGLLALRYPMEHGIVTNWQDMQQIWEYAYSPEQLNVGRGRKRERK